MKQLLYMCLGLFTLYAAPSASQTRKVQLKVVETSDIHGHFFPNDFIRGGELRGTLARASSYIQRQRSQYGDRLLLLDNGDILQGQPSVYWSNYVAAGEENLAASVLNYLRYDAAAVGNHDIETGHKVYDKWISEVRCPVLGANIIDRETGLPYVHPYTLIERDGVRIAVLGMLTPAIPAWLNENLWQGLEFEEMVTSARRWVKHIRKVEHPDLIIGLFHSGKDGGLTLENGIEEDATARIAREVEGFDIIFFGHDHQVHNEVINGVLTLDPSCYGRNVAEADIELTFDGNRLIDKSVKGNIVSLDDEPIDQQMLAHFQPHIEQIKQFVGRRIGTFATGCTTRDAFFGNSAFIDFIHQLQLKITGADISFNAPLAFDAKIDAGPVTVADMFKLYRYENQLAIVKMTGREIRGHLEMSYDLWVNTMTKPSDHLLLLSDDSRHDQQRLGFKNYSFNFDSASGIDYEVDVTRPDGEKVRILRMSNGEPFSEDKVYRVAMNSYRANGGGDLIVHGAGIPKDSLSSRIVWQTELDLRHYLMEEIERQGTVRPQAAHNWRFVPEKWTKAAAQRDRRLLYGK